MTIEKPVDIHDAITQQIAQDHAKLEDAIMTIYLHGDGKTRIKASDHPVLKIIGGYRNEPAIDWEA